MNEFRKHKYEEALTNAIITTVDTYYDLYRSTLLTQLEVSYGFPHNDIVYSLNKLIEANVIVVSADTRFLGGKNKTDEVYNLNVLFDRSGIKEPPLIREGARFMSNVDSYRRWRVMAGGDIMCLDDLDEVGTIGPLTKDQIIGKETWIHEFHSQVLSPVCSLCISDPVGHKYAVLYPVCKSCFCYLKDRPSGS